VTVRPDIVMIMTDQQRAAFTAGTGFGLDTMPCIDALGEAGSRFSHAYTPFPACVPARISLFTGRFPTAHRVRQNSAAGFAHHGDDLLDVLRGQGYRLHFAGKTHFHRGPADFDSWSGPYWHTSGPERTSEQEAFDRWLDELDHGVSTEATPFPLEQQLPYRIVSDALADQDRFADDDRPSFTFVSFPEPHNPYQVPEPYFSLFPPEEVPDRLVGPEVIDRLPPRYRWLHRLVEEKRPGFDAQWRRYRANYCGMLRLIDDQVERLLSGLRQRLTDPIVLFLSDHGDYVGEYGLQRKGAGMPEVLMRIPFQVSGPGIQPQTREEPVSLVDVLPTLCELVGAPIPAGVQGRSLAPLLTGQPAPPAEFGSIYAELGFGGVRYPESARPPLHFPYQGPTFDELNSVTQSGGERMVVRDGMKLIIGDDGSRRLLDLRADPAELENRYDDPAYAGTRVRLLEDLALWMLRVADDLPEAAYRPRAVAHNWRWAPDPGNTVQQGEVQ